MNGTKYNEVGEDQQTDDDDQQLSSNDTRKKRKKSDGSEGGGSGPGKRPTAGKKSLPSQSAVSGTVASHPGMPDLKHTR